MTKSQIRSLQSDLLRLGLYEGVPDGIWGPLSQSAWDEAMRKLQPTTGLAWSAKVSPEFEGKVREIAQRLGIPDPSWLMAAIAWESAETFSPSVKNMAGSGATGLIQFMPATARGLGTTVEELANMTAERQLDWVEKYFQPYRGRLKSLSDIYMAILWPRAIGKPEDCVLWDKTSRPTTYRQNAGLDANRDGVITKREAAAKVQAKLERGYQFVRTSS